MSDSVEDLLTRGVDKIYPSKEELKNVLKSGKKLKLYQGFDPTGSQLHIGHMVGLRKLRQWQELGHHVIFLIGDFTAMVGDPTGRYDTRKMLTREEVLENAKSYQEQAGKILNFTGNNPIEIRFNSEWLGKISGLEFLKISGFLSVQQVVERDMFQERQKRGQDIYMNEFLYPVMQAYDCVVLNVDLELGGSDQMFNMLIGRKLMRHMLHKDKFVLTTPLLEDSEGRKIGKSEGNVIALTDKPKDLFGKIMGFSDDVITKCLEYLTDVPMSEINEIGQKLQYGENPMIYKKMLAFEIVKQLNSTSEAKKAQEFFEQTVQKKQLPQDIPVINLPQSLRSGATITDALAGLELVDSRSEAKRLVAQGAVVIGNETIIDPQTPFVPEDGMVIQVGKRKFVRIKVSS